MLSEEIHCDTPYWRPPILQGPVNGPVGYLNPSVGVAGDGASPGFRYNILCATGPAPCVARDITTRVQDTNWDIRNLIQQSPAVTFIKTKRRSKVQRRQG